MSNSYILIACDDEQAARIIESLRPKPKGDGDMCPVLDGEWDRH